MHRMRKKGMFAMLALLTLALAATTATAGPDATREYVVVYEQGADAAAARAAVERAGGQVVDENLDVGVATVQTREADFAAEARAQDELFGAARNEAIGQAPELDRAKDDVEELEAIERQPASDRGERRRAKGEPLADRQWDMQMIGATAEGSYRKELGDRHVRVGIIDTGIDASHPDIAPNFDRRLSRNFTTDDPLVDGPCAEDPDGSCEDPSDVDEGGHGTHVAGTVGAALNGLGMSGVAPKVKVVNLRAGQDSGYFFLQASVDALTYAGKQGIDVVNMSYYIDPWLYNCTDSPDDTPAEQAEQATIIEATQRALDYAHARGVTLVGSMGNGHSDKTRPAFDDTSPDYPPGAEKDRTVNPRCLTMPNEGRHVLTITALAPSKRKAYYSDYGYGEADLSAPGGDAYDPANVPPDAQPQKQVLSTYPEAVLRRANLIDENGEPRSASVVRSCKGDTCAYYRYLQGTSMASPHAAGVAALAVSRLGQKRRGELGLDPRVTEFVLRGTATDTACPEPRTFVYPGFPAAYTATCEGTPDNNGFYGDGIVDAERVASLGRR
jgi:lantibiotic leader peptide-processing serine protease